MKSSLCSVRVSLLVLAAWSLAVPAAGEDHVSDYALFGGAGVVLESFAEITGAPVGSNGDISHHGGLLVAESLRAAGSFSRSGAAYQSVLGDVLFNGDVVDLGGPGRTVGGSVTAGGEVHLLASVGGGVTCLGHMTTGSQVAIGGNVLCDANVWINDCSGDVGANGDVHVNGDVLGQVIHGGALTIGPFGSVGSSAQGTVTVEPDLYAPVAMPALSQSPPGGPDVHLALFDDVTLEPNAYGALTFAGSNDLRLSAGRYFFDRVESLGAFVTIHFDTTAGDVEIFVDANVSLTYLEPIVNGQDVASADPNLAAGIYVETGGSWSSTGAYMGCLFAPDGDVELGATGPVVGSAVAGGTLTLGNCDVTYVRSRYLTTIPEPASAAIWLSLAAAAGLRRRRRCRRALA